MSNRKPPPTRWAPGQSGNPKGRPPGRGAGAELRAAISQHMPAILERLVQQALGGDVQASRVLVERVCPPLRASEEPTPLSMPAGGSLTERGTAVLDALNDGALTASQAQQILASIAALARVSESDDLQARVVALEAATGIAPPPPTPAPHGGT